MSHARFEANNFFFIHLNEGVLRLDVLKRVLLEEQLGHNIEKAVRVKLQKEGDLPVTREEAHNVVDEAAPLKYGERPRGELLALDKESSHPEQLISDVGSAVLYV